jgi:tetratricopeptide (TPR) repeat protein
MFVGGCRIEHAEAVADPDGTLGIDLLDGLQALVEKSLLRRRDDADGEPRFWMLATIREFALEQLALFGGEGELKERHACYFAEFAYEHRSGEGHAVTELIAELDNFRVAREWLHRNAGVEEELRLVSSLLDLWDATGRLAEGRSWLEALLARVDQSRSTLDERLRLSEELSRAWFALAGLTWRAGNLRRAKEAVERSREIDLAAGDSRGAAKGLVMLGLIATDEGSLDEAERLSSRMVFATSTDAATALMSLPA